MFGNLKLSVKLYLGFGVVTLLILVIAANSIWSVDRLQGAGHHFEAAADKSLFLVHKEVDHLNWINAVQEMFVNNLDELKVQLDETKCSLGKFIYGPEAQKMAAADPEFAALLDEIKGPHARLHQSGKAIKETWQKNHPGLALTLAARLDDHRRWAASLSGSILENKPVTVQVDPTKCAFGKWLASPDTKELMAGWPQFAALMDKVHGHHAELHSSAREIMEASGQAAKVNIFNTKTKPQLEALGAIFKETQSLETALNDDQDQARHIFASQTLPALAATQAKLKGMTDHLSQVRSAAQEEMSRSGRISITMALSFGGAALILGVLLSFLITRSIAKPINKIITGLKEGSELVASASSQVSASSQQLAEGSSEQAASLEETSSSLEEMASMTKSNADNSSQADNLMKEARRIIGQSGQEMEEMAGSMGQIAEAGGEISKIVKSIDEIAFQTNLLALNAAVEAARAGEAGMGFAVVADEVRSLAMRAAEAAKNTQTLVEQTVSRINQGSELVTRTQSGFKGVSKTSDKVASLVSEIAAASAEQSLGIDQVNTAVGQMDQVVQVAAAGAEESASASQELNAQAETMRSIVSDLTALITGRQALNGAGSNGHDSDDRKLLSPAPEPTKTAKPVSRVVTPHQAIPFDEDEKELAEF